MRARSCPRRCHEAREEPHLGPGLPQALPLAPSPELRCVLCLVFCQETGSSAESVPSGFPLLRQHSVSSLRQLVPFFRTLNCAFKAQSRPPADTREPPLVGGPVPDSPRVLRQLEECVEGDFLEHLEC